MKQSPRTAAKKKTAGAPTVSGKEPSGAVLGFEQNLWEAADKLRGSMDPSEYKHVVLGLLFLKYLSDAFEEKHEALTAEGENAEDRDHYSAENIYWVPREARFTALLAKAKQKDIGVLLDAAMESLEDENPTLKGTLPRDYARPQLDKARLGELLGTIANIALRDPARRSQDLLGRAYEYFLAKFASAEGRLGGDFYTPQSVVRVMVEMIEPLKGRVFDPCCGSGGMFVQSEKFVEAHGGGPDDLSVFGQESNPTTWRLARMNLAIRRIPADLGKSWGDSFQNDQHPSLKAHYVLANPPFNVSDWGGPHLRGDVRWSKYGAPPDNNANFAWMQHILHHLSPAEGVGAVVMANGSMSSQQSNEGSIRQKMVEGDVVDCMVALPGQLFYATGIPVCLWIFARNKGDKRFRDRKGEVLFIDARKMGTLVDRVHRELTEADITRIATAYHAWRGEKSAGKYADEKGFCKSANLEEIASHGYVLTPGRYVGAEDVEEDEEPFEEKMKRLTKTLFEQMAEEAKLDGEIRRNLRGLGYGG